MFPARQGLNQDLLTLRAIDARLVKECMIPRFLDCFYAGCRDEELKAFVDEAAAG